MINSLFRRFIISHSQFEMLHLSFPEFQDFPHYLIAKIHLNHYKDSPCVFNFSFLPFDHSFVYRSSSWRFYMMVHQEFNSFSKRPLRFFSKELKFFFILHSDVQFLLSHILRWYYVILDNLSSCFMIHKLSRMRYFKSINLVIGVSWVKFSLKAFPKDCCYLWCS